jgi:2-haloacid dehalogenase
MPARQTATAYAFDAYGTLFDVHAAIGRYRDAVGEDADLLSALWRSKQLEYSWVRTLMGKHRDFWSLTEEALDFALARFPSVDKGIRAKLLDAYWRLEAYPDVCPTLIRLRRMGLTLAIFTNGTQEMAESAASASAVLPLVDMVVSVDDVRQFKTSPAVYAHLCKRLDMAPRDVCLVSSNRWDIAGGAAFGLQTIWVNRTGQPDEYFDAQPDRDVKSLSEIV